MALPLVAHAGQGVDGATVGTGESGSGNPWDATVGTPTITYAPEHARGRMGYEVVAGASAQQMSWTSTSLGTITEVYGRFYLWSHGNPSTATGLFRFTAGGSQTARIRYNADGTLTISDAGNAAEVTTTALTTGALIRIGFYIEFVASNATVTLNVYDTHTSLTPSETVTSSTAAGMGTSADRVDIGSFNNATWTGCLSDIALSGTAEPPPILSALPPTYARSRALLVR
jgi:hypothetical protein